MAVVMTDGVICCSSKVTFTTFAAWEAVTSLTPFSRRSVLFTAFSHPPQVIPVTVS